MVNLNGFKKFWVLEFTTKIASERFYIRYELIQQELNRILVLKMLKRQVIRLALHTQELNSNIHNLLHDIRTLETTLLWQRMLRFYIPP